VSDVDFARVIAATRARTMNRAALTGAERLREQIYNRVKRQLATAKVCVQK